MTRVSQLTLTLGRTATALALGLALLPGVANAAAKSAPAPAPVAADMATGPVPEGSHYPRDAAEFDRMFEEVKNWGRWGPDDELGTANLITAEKRKQALTLGKLGLSISLAHPIITKTGKETRATLDNGAPMEITVKPDIAMDLVDTYNIDYHGFLHTHVDAVCHFFWKGKMYNGRPVPSAEDSKKGCPKAGIDKMASGLITRGVIVDIPWVRNIPYLVPGTPVYASDFEAWERKTGIHITTGDAVFLRTGRWARWEKLGPWSVMTEGFAGFHASLAPWLKARGVAVLGTDSGDVFPSGVKGVMVAGHVAVINAMGMPLFDDMDLEEAAKTANRLKRWEFLFMAAPLVVPGGTGSPVNPLAIF